jgi:hypothetical protein
MGRAITHFILSLVPIAVLVSAAATASASIFVNFDSDTAAVNLLDPFTSVDSPLIHFSDSVGAELFVVSFDGSNALAVLDDDDSGLLMEFDFIASALSLEIGNASLANFGDTAELIVLLGGVEVDSVTVALNGTDAIDQTISYAGGSFDSAFLRYNVAGGLTEVVDNIEVAPAAPSVPEPGAGFLFGVGALLVGVVCSRRSPSGAGHRTMYG